MRLRFWRKREPVPPLRCDTCEQIATCVWGLGSGREWIRCDAHALSKREWTAIKELDSQANGYSCRDDFDVTEFGSMKPQAFLSVGRRHA